MAKMLKRSPHFGQHVAHGAKDFFDFAGWEMPTHFSSLAAGSACMPQCRDPVRWTRHGRTAHSRQGCAQGGAEAMRERYRARLQPGMMVYTSLCTEDGGIFDDLVVFCLAPDHYLLTMAAFNTHKTPGWVEKHTAGMNVCVMDLSAGTTCIEIQGPKSRQILQKIADFDVSDEALALLPVCHRQSRRASIAWSRGSA